MSDRKIKDFIQKWVPSYAVVPVACCLIVNTIGYFGVQLISGMLHFHDFSLPPDRRIPLVPAFVFVYVGAYAQWILGFLQCARDSRSLCYRYMSAEVTAKLVTILCFLVVPSTIIRPAVSSSGPAELLLRWIYMHDGPVNLFPSIHCLESWFCLRAAFAQKKTGRLYSLCMTVMTLLVFASVLLVRQHVIVDILGGIGVFELGMLLTRRRDFTAFYESVSRRLARAVRGRSRT